MGRKRAKEPRLQDDWVALVTSVSDECLTVVLALTKLSVALQKKDALQEVELAAEHLRQTCSVCLDYLKQGTDLIVYLHRQLLQQQLNLSIDQQLTILSMQRAYLQQTAQQEDVLLDVEAFLDHDLYIKNLDSNRLERWKRVLGNSGEVIARHEMSWRAVLQPNSDPLDYCSEGIEENNLEVSTPVAADNRVKQYLDENFDSVLEAVEAYVQKGPLRHNRLLLWGPPGAGKSYVCTEITSIIMMNLEIRFPQIPLDFLGARVGDAERSLLSLFEPSTTTDGRLLILMDNIDVLVNETQGDTVLQSSSASRLKPALLSCLENVDPRALVVCTSTIPLSEWNCFDRIYELEPPNHDERVAMLQAGLGILPDQFQSQLTRLATHTLGRSRSEIAQYCRHAITKLLMTTDLTNVMEGQESLLRSMLSNLSQLAPESLRSGVVDGFVDMTVVSARELLQTSPDELPLFGQEEAWRQLESFVVMPLVHAEALDRMLGLQSSRRFAGGVLLASGPGTGKTTLAYHAARVAATKLPSLKLLDVNCTSLIHKEVGGSERAVKRLLAAARSAAPCIILLDGIENIAAVRGKDMTTHGTMDRVLSTLLMELDGVEAFENKSSSKFAVIGVTQNASWIDAALRRPGRLDKVVEMQKPNREVRFLVAKRELSRMNLCDDTLDIDVVCNLVADSTGDKTAAQVVAACNEARLQCAKEIINRFEWLGSVGEDEPSLSLKHFSLALK